MCSVFRSALDGAGKGIEITKYTEKLVPSTRFVAVDGVAPTVSEACFVAPSASVIGDVTIGQESRYAAFVLESSYPLSYHRKASRLAFCSNDPHNFHLLPSAVSGTELPFEEM